MNHKSARSILVFKYIQFRFHMIKGLPTTSLLTGPHLNLLWVPILPIIYILKVHIPTTLKFELPQPDVGQLINDASRQYRNWIP